MGILCNLRSLYMLYSDKHRYKNKLIVFMEKPIIATLKMQD